MESSRDIITIEDSPPVSPTRAGFSTTYSSATATTTEIGYRNMSGADDEFSPTEQAMIWSQATTNFIKNTMDLSVQNNDKMLSLHHKMNLLSFNRYQTNSNTTNTQDYHHHHQQYSEMSNYLPDYGYNQNAPPQYQYYPYYGYYPNMNYQQEFMFNFERANYLNYLRSYYGDYKDNNQENTDPSSPYYLNVKTENLDIEAGAVQVQVQVQPFDELHDTQSRPLQNIANKTVDVKQPTIKGKKKSQVPLFLKRNRCVMDHKQTATLTSPPAEDDVVFVKEYKCDTSISMPVVSQAAAVITPALVGRQLPQRPQAQQAARPPVTVLQTVDKCDRSESVVRAKQEHVGAVVVRRNPRRQVQVEKSVMKMIDEVLGATAKSERKARKLTTQQQAAKTTRPATATATATAKNLRRSKRNLPNCGATYRAPLPFTARDFKVWPVEGGHDRPEYNPVTKTIEPFDRHIQNISKDFAQPKPSTANIATQTIPIASKLTKKKCKTLQEVSHEMLHHVLAYAVRIKKYEQEECRKMQEQEKEHKEKVEFLNDLCLNKVKMETDQSCELLQQAVGICKENGRASSSNEFGVLDLLQNSILMYCLTNNVEQDEVARYIATITPEEVLDVSNEMLELPANQ